eukprot:6846556-Karenia_brevis.AAC.1
MDRYRHWNLRMDPTQIPFNLPMLTRLHDENLDLGAERRTRNGLRSIPIRGVALPHKVSLRERRDL